MKSFTVDGITYNFPSEHVDAVSPADTDRPYARIHPPGSEFVLEYSLKSLRPNSQGEGIPTIPNINDVPGPHDDAIEVINNEDGPVVCEPGLREYNCGLMVADSGVHWRVRFNDRAISRSKDIRNAAIQDLRGYHK